ncbi:MAG: hypothetical protein HC838_14565 [Spirulinaceae cyanobacterium RM2_2_10]|nr:hypothetical protein [Spirulinaceae cyanobacterium RM2_2_10]
MNPLLEVAIKLSVALIPGVLNLMVALDELDQQARFLVFFKPIRSLGFWLWVAIQLAFPAVFFWYFLELATKPIQDVANLQFILEEAAGKGIIFIAVMNARVELGPVPLNIKALYKVFVQQAFRLIDRNQADVTSEFWTEFEVALLQRSDDELDAGIRYLENYFALGLRPAQEKKDYEDKLQQIKQEAHRAKKVSALIQVMDVRRQHLARALGWFSCDELKQKFEAGWSAKISS